MPQDGLVVELADIIYNSCTYYIANRCGEVADVTMPTISHFDTIPLVARLGHTVTELSKSILLEIERNVKIIENERSAKNEQRRHLEQQRTSSPAEQLTGGRNDGGRQGTAPRQVRQNGNESSARNQPPKVFTFEDAGRTYQPDVQSGRGSDGAANSSTDIQDLQLDMLHRYGQKMGYDPCVEYCDWNKSGSTLDRPNMQKLLTSIRVGKVKRIIVKDISRLTRNMQHLNELMCLFHEYDVELISVSDNEAVDMGKGASANESKQEKCNEYR